MTDDDRPESGDDWMDWEVTILKEMYPEKGPKWLSTHALSNRTRHGIREKAIRVGLKYDHSQDHSLVKWIVAMLVSTAHTIEEIAEVCDVHRTTVGNINRRTTFVEVVSEFLDIDADVKIRSPEFTEQLRKFKRIGSALTGGEDDQ